MSLDLGVSHSLSIGSLGWQKLDLTPVVQKWYGKLTRHRIRHQNHHGRGGTKLTLLVDCSGCVNSIYPITFSHNLSPLRPTPESPESSATSTHQTHLTQPNTTHSPSAFTLPPRLRATENESELPFLVLETESSPHAKRNRRRALECTQGIKTCCKQKFFISFQELGWDDWIIAPRGYYANYCRGHCGGAHRTPDTFLNYHTHVMEEYRRTEAGRLELSGITPCCAPTKFSPMSLIYFGPDLNIIKRDLPKMIVDECGCP